MFSQGWSATASGGNGVIAQGFLATASGSFGSFAQGGHYYYDPIGFFPYYYPVVSTGIDGSFAQGRYATSFGNKGSFAQGYKTTSFGNNGSFAQGTNVESRANDGSFAQGRSATASGSFGSFAQGFQATAAGYSGSFAMGSQCTASGNDGSFALGNSAKALNSGAFAFGATSSATAAGAVQFGAGTNSQANTLRVGTGPRLDNTPPTQNELLTTDANNIIKSTPTIITSETGSAVNQITVTDAISTNGPIIAATGVDPNIDLNLNPKGSGGVILGGTATGQSTIASGLVVNDDGGATATDDFRVETTSQTSAFEVDASANLINTNVPISMSDGTNDYLKLPYLTGAPSGLSNGMVWMESDGIHMYRGGTEYVVAGV